MNNERKKKILVFLRQFVTIFLIVSFVITCCILLFIRLLIASTGIELTSDNIELAAKLTFLNIIALTTIFTVIDAVRRRYTVIMPIKKIAIATEKVVSGDLSVRVEKHQVYDSVGLNQVIEYFNKMIEELSSIETLRTDFISNVSHEMKTPLAVIENYATLLKSPDLTEEKRREYAEAISLASTRLANLITNILRLNKLENQQIFISPEPYDLSEQLREAILSFETVWEKKNISIEIEMPDELEISADKELFSLVWNNLISNALKFTSEGGTVSLTLTKEENGATVKIKDTGCGISKETGNHIFEKFYQGDTSHATEGNGLGLTLVKRIIDITKSEISVESEIGKGSTFTIRIYNNGKA